MNKVPEKLEDPGKFLIPCALKELDRTSALADSGASINLLPHSIYKQLELRALKPTRMTLELANLGKEDLVYYADKSEKNKNKHFVHAISVIDFSKDDPFSGRNHYAFEDPSPSSSPVKTVIILRIRPTNPLFEENDKDVEIKSSSSFTLTSPEESEFEAYLEIDSIPPGIDLTLPLTLEVSSSNPTLPYPTGEKDLKKDLTVALDSTNSSILPPPLLDSDSPFTAELSASITLNSLGNEDKVFKPGILVYHAIHDKNLVTLEENLKENISSGTLLVFKEPSFLLPPPEPPDDFLNFEPNLVMKNVVLNEDFYQSKKTLPLNVEDVNSFTFIIWTFLPYFTYTEESPLIFSFRSTDISKITRKPSKTGKHRHEERKSTKEARDAKPKAGKVKKSKLWSTLGQFSASKNSQNKGLLKIEGYKRQSKWSTSSWQGEISEIKSSHWITQARRPRGYEESTRRGGFYSILLTNKHKLSAL
ncbi:reverse transcriptase domain-containing protein [Tanacetum coccineum]